MDEKKCDMENDEGKRPLSDPSSSAIPAKRHGRNVWPQAGGEADSSSSSVFTVDLENLDAFKGRHLHTHADAEKCADTTHCTLRTEIKQLEQREMTYAEQWAHEQKLAVELRAKLQTAHAQLSSGGSEAARLRTVEERNTTLTKRNEDLEAQLDKCKQSLARENNRNMETMQQRIKRLNSEVSSQRQILQTFEQQRVAWQSKIEDIARENKALRSASTQNQPARPSVPKTSHTAQAESRLSEDLKVLMGDPRKRRHLFRLVHPDGNASSNEGVTSSAARILQLLHATDN